MKSLTKFVMLGLLLIPFAVIVNVGNVFAAEEGKYVEVEIVAGSANAGENKSYNPKEVTIAVGTTVEWENKDSAGHTVTSGNPGDSDFGALFDSTKDPAGFLVKPGGSWKHTFDKAGKFPYFCEVHPWMLGKVTVSKAAATPPTTPPMGGKMAVTYGDKSFDVEASLSNGSVKSIDVDPDFTSLLLTVETSATANGELMITLPRELIDAKNNGADDSFIVLVDGDEVDYEEHHVTATERALKIELPAGVEEVEIVGSQVIPEFPVTVMAVMGAIVATAIAVTRFNPLKP